MLSLARSISMEVIISTGVRFHAFHLAKQLQKRGFLKRIITGSRAKVEGVDLEKVTSLPLPRLMYRVGRKAPLIHKYIQLRYWQSVWFDWLSQKKIEDADIFVGWSGFSLNSMRKAKFMGAKAIIERGSSHILFQKEILEEEYRRYGLSTSLIDQGIVEMELKEYEEADAISIPSDFVYQSFLSKGVDEEKLIKVPYGVDIEKFKPRAPANDDIFRVISVGATHMRKGLPYLLEAWSQLDLKQAELVIRGDVPRPISWLIEKYRRKCDFTIIGYINDINRFYNRGSVFVLPSVEEGSARVVYEAMATGLPSIVTSNCGSVIENGKQGFVIPIRDVEALKKKILYLYHNPEERMRMGRAARQQAKEFTWDKYGERIVEAYKNLLN